MNKRTLRWLAGLLALAFVTWLALAPSSDREEEPMPLRQSSPSVTQTSLARTGSAPPSAIRLGTAPVAAVAPPAGVGESAYTPEQRGETNNAEVLQELDQVQLMLRDYRAVLGENPIGTNAEIMAALAGGNPRQARLGPPEGQGMNEKGELVDRWGTPYFFHQIDGQHMEVHSAGPDRRLGTADDIVR